MVTSTSNKCVARENLGLCPASPYSEQVEGGRTGMVRCWIPCYKNPTYVAGTRSYSSPLRLFILYREYFSYFFSGLNLIILFHKSANYNGCIWPFRKLKILFRELKIATSPELLGISSKFLFFEISNVT